MWTLIAFALSSQALAAKDPELVAQKEHVKALAKYDREVDRLVRRWEKAVEKGRADDRAELEGELGLVAEAERAALEARGIGVEPAPVELAGAGTAARRPEPERPKREAFHEALIELDALWSTERPRELRREGRLLGQLRDAIEARHARAEERYEAAKSGV